ncbi:MAG: ATP-dependent Clp protease ATP-binding subunit ClpX, partial [Ruminococcaceae bacterium]|nr:ATP-dependent Clp protease ATP-binding subunit ClpX [Oscillospiraceae bacterium]
IDTTNILFICGGAFEGIEKIIERRTGTKSLGFGGEVLSKNSMDIGKYLSLLEPQDLLKFGLIPELVGRLPVITTLDLLDQEALVNIICEPKNALLKQYKKLFELDGVKLEMKPEAIRAVAQKALERKTGARGLRSIMEESLLDIMYALPSEENVSKCVITEDCVLKKAKPELIYKQKKAEQPALAESVS